MFTLNIFIRSRCLRASTPLQLKKFLSAKNDDSGHSSDSSDDEKEMVKTRSNRDALKRLNFLLQSMVDDTTPVPSKLAGQLARPKPQTKKTEVSSGKDAPESSTRTSGDALADAAKEVARSLGRNVEVTESELLSKLRSHSLGNGDASKPNASLSELIVGMKIDRSPKQSTEPEHGRAQQVRAILSRGQAKPDTKFLDPRSPKMRRPRPDITASRVDLLGGEPLGIFQPVADPSTVPETATTQLATWSMLQKRELRLAITHPPSNVFEEMIQWTEKGKLWKFPINNEQGLEDESKVYFTEHVFLEHLLEPWCPRVGPVRHFMELVCTGLSKNPYITVQDKHDHIAWFRDYFEKKHDLLQQAGALGDARTPTSQKNIEAE